MAGESAGPSGGEDSWRRWKARLDLRFPFPFTRSRDADLWLWAALLRCGALGLPADFEVAVVAGLARLIGLDLGAAFGAGAVGALGGADVSARAAPAISAEMAQTKAEATPRFDERLDLGPNFKP